MLCEWYKIQPYQCQWHNFHSFSTLLSPLPPGLSLSLSFCPPSLPNCVSFISIHYFYHYLFSNGWKSLLVNKLEIKEQNNQLLAGNKQAHGRALTSVAAGDGKTKFSLIVKCICGDNLNITNIPFVVSLSDSFCPSLFICFLKRLGLPHHVLC